MYRINCLTQQIDFKTTTKTLKKDLIFHHITFFHFHSECFPPGLRLKTLFALLDIPLKDKQNPLISDSL